MSVGVVCFLLRVIAPCLPTARRLTVIWCATIISLTPSVTDLAALTEVRNGGISPSESGANDMRLQVIPSSVDKLTTAADTCYCRPVLEKAGWLSKYQAVSKELNQQAGGIDEFRRQLYSALAITITTPVQPTPRGAASHLCCHPTDHAHDPKLFSQAKHTSTDPTSS